MLSGPPASLPVSCFRDSPQGRVAFGEPLRAPLTRIAPARVRMERAAWGKRRPSVGWRGVG